jgi:hypothetical protein
LKNALTPHYFPSMQNHFRRPENVHFQFVHHGTDGAIVQIDLCQDSRQAQIPDVVISGSPTKVTVANLVNEKAACHS